MTLDSNLVASYKLDSGALTTDSVGANTLTNNNTVGEGTAFLGTSCADFGSSNTNKSLSIDSALVSLGSAITVSCWVKMRAAPGVGQDVNFVIGVNGVESGTYWGIFYGNVSGTLKVRGRSNASMDYIYTLPTTSWTHILITQPDATGTRYLYVNGVQRSSDAGFTGSYAAAGNNFSIGAQIWDNAAAGFASAYIDDVNVWNRVLTTGEIEQLYNSGVGLTSPFYTPGTPPSPMAIATRKTINGIPIASVKTWNGIANASLKTFN